LWPPLLDHYVVQGCKYFRGLLWPLSSGQKSRRVRYIFDVSRTVHCNIYIYIYIYIANPTRCTISQIYFILEQHCTCFGPSLRPSSEVLRPYIHHQVYVVQAEEFTRRGLTVNAICQTLMHNEHSLNNTTIFGHVPAC